MEEQWKDVVGFEGLYEVSDLGRVRRHTNSRPRRYTWPGRVLKGSFNAKGYLRIELWKPGHKRRCGRKFIHVLVTEAFIGPRPEGLQIDHMDRDKLNNRKENLRYVTGEVNRANSGAHPVV